MQALLPAGTFALGVAASSLVRQKRNSVANTFNNEKEVGAVARISQMLESLYEKYKDEDRSSGGLMGRANAVERGL